MEPTGLVSQKEHISVYSNLEILQCALGPRELPTRQAEHADECMGDRRPRLFHIQTAKAASSEQEVQVCRAADQSERGQKWKGGNIGQRSAPELLQEHEASLCVH